MENITVCIRMKPKRDEREAQLKVEGNTIYNSKTKEIFAFDKIFEPNVTNDDLFSNHIKETIDKFISGINVSIFAYGQTSTGKTFTMTGDDSNPGIIPNSIKYIFSKLNESGCLKFTVKASYLELYNETVNDLLDASKKNLEIRESLQRGIFVNHLTEVPITDSDKAFKLIKQGENVKIIAETKLNEKSSRSHSLFRLTLEVQKIVGDINKTYISQLNLIDLAGSENVNKAKTEGLRLKEGANINKSLLALSNVIQKLSISPKSFVSYRDSKLTRLLQPALNGNSKTTIICTVTDNPSCISETLNTLHFGLKAKNIKTNVKINEITDEKNKMMNENNTLKGKIKQLEDLIIESTSSNEDGINSFNNKIKSQNDMITALEKEIGLLKRVLLNNEEIGEDTTDNISQNSNNLYTGLTNNYAKIFSASKMSDSARKMKTSNSYLFEPQNDYIMKDPSESIFKRCMTEMKNKRLSLSNTKLSGYKHPDMDFDYFEHNNSSNDGYLTLLKENDDLRKNIFELRKNYIETVQNKDNQIKSLNYNMNMTIDNCERIIKEAEENYMNLKLIYDRMKDDIVNKDNEICSLSQSVRSNEATIAFYKDEIHKLKQERNSDKVYKDLENKLNEVTKRYDSLSKEYDCERSGISETKILNEKLKSESANLKTQVENMRGENVSIRSQLEMFKKSNDMLTNEINRLKNDIESYKNEITGLKDKNNKIKTELNQIKKSGTNNDNSSYVKHLETQINEYKETLAKIEETQIAEYQKLLDESFSKISELQIDLQIALEKNGILEKRISQGIQVSVQNSINKTVFNTEKKKTTIEPKCEITQFSLQEGSALKENTSYSNSKDFLNKKRLLPRAYQGVFSKNLLKSETPRKENLDN